MKSMFLAALCAAPLAAAATAAAAAAPVCSRQSPAHTVALLELYTSEGCSSCPPADRFVSGLRASSGSAAGHGDHGDRLVPLSLHVDYWNDIGWVDRFSSATFTERQRWLSGLVGSRTIYTPEFFLAGREDRGWYRDLDEAVRRINAKPAQADIRIAFSRPAGGKLPFEVKARAGQAAKLFVALYQNGIQTEVRAGENKGATLRHDYVVREWLGPVAVPAAGDGMTLARLLDLPAGAEAKNLGLAAFVQNDRGEVLQALSLPLCE
jgi:hypothetical protein